MTQNSTELETHGIVVANMDRSVKPGDDFYRYANGGWIKRTEIPRDRSSIGINDSLIDLSFGSFQSGTRRGILRRI